LKSYFSPETGRLNYPISTVTAFIHRGVVMIQEQCKHLIARTMSNGERTLKCRLGVNEQVPFACPEGCVFFEPKTTSSAGWQVGSPKPGNRN